MQFHYSHEFDIDAPTYWKIFLSDEFVEDMNRDLKMKGREKIKQTDDGKTFYRVQKMMPSTSIPGFMQTFIKAADYTEIDTLDWATNTMKVVIEMDMMKDRFKMSGDYVVTPLGDGTRCRREFRGEIKVSVPLVGGKIEKTVIDQMASSYDIAAATMRRWIAKHKQSA